MSWRSMFIEDDGSWPGLGFNPAKGDTEALGLLASDVKAVGDELDDLRDLIKKAGDHGSWWEGEAAQNFAKKLGDLPKYLQQGTDSMQECAKALRSWQSKLETFQERTGRLEPDAVEARKRAEETGKRYDQLYAEYQPQFGTPMPVEEADRINKQMEDARQAANSANDRLDDLIREGERIHANWKDRAGEAERAIREASENHPPDLGFWDRMADSLKGAWGDFKEWLIDNADALSTWSSGLAVAAMAVNCIPVVGQVASAVLGTASALCAAGAMAGHWMDNARGGKTPGWKIGLDALGAVPIVGGAAKGAIAGWKGGAGLVGKAGSATKGLVGKDAAKGVIEGIENPLSMKGINWGLRKAFNKTDDVLPPAATQSVIKGASTINGLWQQRDTPAEGGDQSQAAPAPSSSKFQQTLAA